MDFTILLLIAAALISFVIGLVSFARDGGGESEFIDGAAIIVIVVLNAIFGFTQEYRAEKAIDALKELAAPKATVIRDGVKLRINSRELVPDDVILLEAGDRVPADCILLEDVQLRVDESALTGESVPVSKSAKDSEKNCVFLGTTAVYGKATAKITHTGMKTKIGEIAELVQSVEDEQTPLQEKLEETGKTLGFICLGLCVLVFIVGFFMREAGLLDMFLTSVSLAVAAIPEGLPAVVTITMAIGVQRMAKRNAIVRKLAVVETLGCANIICSDKTGTLTKNEMTVRKILLGAGRVLEVSGNGYAPVGEFTNEKTGKTVLAGEDKELLLLLKAAALCNNASLSKDATTGSYIILGDPTEGALVVTAEKAGLAKDTLASSELLEHEIPFDSDKKRMTTIHHVIDSGRHVSYTKGAPEVVLGLCSHVMAEDGARRKLTDSERERILDVNDEFAKSALRVLGVCYGELEGCGGASLPPEKVEIDLTFVGLMGMIDPPRPEAKRAVELCKHSGIRTIMITGDHELTAIAIAKELDILPKKSPEGKKLTLTGAELELLTDDEFDAIAEDLRVYSRVFPHHKMRIVKALAAKGYVVAMTGDGVNDAPALKQADIGISMGLSGTDVAKEASDMILTDDNFASIVAAVEEGRTVYENIKKPVQYLLSSNAGEIFILFFGILLAFPLPLVAVQLLWVNLVTDGLPAIALSLEPPERHIMNRPPRNRNESMFSRDMIMNIVLVGLLMTVSGLLLFKRVLDVTANVDYARTVLLTTVVMFEMFNVFMCRSNLPIQDSKPFSNKWVWIGVLSSVVLHLVFMYVPVLRPVLHATPLSLVDWGWILGVCVTAFAVVELARRLMDRRHERLGLKQL